jgi:uncharacterized membrane protein YfcA
VGEAAAAAHVGAGALAAGGGVSDVWLVVVVTAAAFAGAVIGARVLRKTTFTTVQRIVAAMLVAIALGMITGVV